MTLKEEYIAFCETQSDLPLFMQPWWLDGVCAGKQWDVLISRDEQGGVAAVLPYLIRKRFWMRYILMPQETQIGGVWIRADLRDSMMATRRITEDIAAQLRGLKLAYYYQHYPLGSAVPPIMKELGFRVKDRVTYRVEDLTDIDKVIDSFSKNKKRQLQKALSLHVDLTLSSEDFYIFHKQCLAEQDKEISYTREFFLVMYQKTQKHHNSQILAIRNADNVLVAAVFLVWDKHSMYYLIPCYSPAYKETGASALLALESMKLARQHALAFDFEGSMIRGVANHYKQFGSTATTYHSVSKYYNPLFALLLFGNWLRNRKFG